MKEIALSKEQMKHLEELGLDTSDASMYYTQFGLYPQSLVVNDADKDEDDILTYTLQDILDKLPKEIDDKQYNNKYGKFNLGINCILGKTWSCNYSRFCYGGTTHLIFFHCESLLEACYNMLCWCIEKKYI